MIQDRINPKFKLLNSSSQTIWLLFETLQDYKTHQLYYAIDTLCELTGHHTQSIIKSISDLEQKQIIVTNKKHRQVTHYLLLESILIKRNKFKYEIGDSLVLTFKTSKSDKSKPRKVKVKTKNTQKNAPNSNDIAVLQDKVETLSPLDLSPLDLSNIPNKDHTNIVHIASTEPTSRKDKIEEEMKGISEETMTKLINLKHFKQLLNP